MRRRVASALSVLLLAVGGVQGGRGAWIYAKAELAQILLRRSWAETVAGRERVRPWPWADAWPVARIILPDGDHIVLGGASGRNLAFAPGHLDGTAPPGGAGTCVIAGHRDTHFTILEDLVPGDVVGVEDASGSVTRYRVVAAAVVDESRTDVLADSAVPTLVLITCWPFNAIDPGGPLRYVVFAEIVETFERSNVQTLGSSGIGWSGRKGSASRRPGAEAVTADGGSFRFSEQMQRQAAVAAADDGGRRILQNEGRRVNAGGGGH